MTIAIKIRLAIALVLTTLFIITPSTARLAPESGDFYGGAGNVTDYVDAFGGVAAHFEYNSSGCSVVSNDASNTFTYRFSTKPVELALGMDMYLYPLRVYDASLGTFLSRDPIAESGGLNLYGFCGNDAVNGWDYLGLIPPASEVGWDTRQGKILPTKEGMGELAEIVAPIIVEWAPIACNATSAYKACTGKSLTGEQLSALERCAELPGIFAGGPGKAVVKAGTKLGVKAGKYCVCKNGKKYVVEVTKFAKKPPVKATKLKGNQGWVDSSGNNWKKDKLHKDHWDVVEPKNGKKIKEVDFNGNQIWPNGPKNKNKK